MFLAIKPHFFLEIGRNFWRGPRTWGLSFGLFDRGPDCPHGEYSLRLVVEIGIHRPGRRGALDRSPPGLRFYRQIIVTPAWWDVPSARAEYQRTMRR